MTFYRMPQINDLGWVVYSSNFLLFFIIFLIFMSCSYTFCHSLRSNLNFSLFHSFIYLI